MRNQHQIQLHNKNLILASVDTIQFPPSSRSSNWSVSNNFQKQANSPHLYCSNCGGNWLSSHQDKCVAKRKTCNNCGLLNYFSKVCHKQKNSKPQNPKKGTVNTVDEDPHPEDSVIFFQSSELSESDYSSGEYNMVAHIQNDIAKTETLNMPTKIGIISPTLLVDSCSVCSFLKQSLA